MILFVMDSDLNVHKKQTECLYTRRPTIKTTLVPGGNSNSLQITVPEYLRLLILELCFYFEKHSLTLTRWKNFFLSARDEV